MHQKHWHVWVDTGGTFTDCLAVDPGGELHRVKVLSSSALRGRVRELVGARALRLDGAWDLPDGFAVGADFRLMGSEGRESRIVGAAEGGHLVELADDLGDDVRPGLRCELRAGVEAPVLAAYLATRTPLVDELPPLAMRLATTRGTNALLERRGAPTVLFITRGLGDLLVIGTQQRPELFALQVEKPAPLYEEVVEVPERLAADGSVVEALDEAAVRVRAAELVAGGYRCAAVALMHAYRNPAHEHRVAAILRAEGFAHVSCSAELAPLIKLLPRAQTAVVDAYLAPVIGDYLKGVAGAVGAGTVQVMTSAGGLVAASAFQAKDALLSGPAGGVVGVALAARRSGLEKVIALDMGGTSTDVARWDGDFEYVFSHRVGDAHLMAPALAIESVAAGGGSVCHCEAGQLKVGPHSAGADPGPACYGAGGPLTLTDVNLLLGRLAPDRFEIPIVPEAAARALGNLGDELQASGAARPPDEDLLEGLLQIANERMASAIRRISVRRGYDPARYALVAFGGAGAQHACAVASMLAMTRVLVPPDASLLSAAGLGHALVERFAHRQVLRRLADCRARAPEIFAELEHEARSEVAGEGIAASKIVIRRRLAHLRLEGQDAVLAVEWSESVNLSEEFASQYRVLYGYDPPPRPVEVESLRVVASTAPPDVETCPVPCAVDEAPGGARNVHMGQRWRGVDVHERDALPPGAGLRGPAVVVERHTVTVVEPGWRLCVDGAGALVMDRALCERGPDER